MLKPIKITIFRPNLCKTGALMGHTQNKKQFFFFRNNKSQILSFQNLFILTKYHMFWLSYECFSILCNAFLLKSAISSHNSCVVLRKKSNINGILVWKNILDSVLDLNMGRLAQWWSTMFSKLEGFWFQPQSWFARL